MSRFPSRYYHDFFLRNSLFSALSVGIPTCIPVMDLRSMLLSLHHLSRLSSFLTSGTPRQFCIPVMDLRSTLLSLHQSSRSSSFLTSGTPRPVCIPVMDLRSTLLSLQSSMIVLTSSRNSLYERSSIGRAPAYG